MSLLNNKVAVITGGSSGIGLATAKRFVEEGAYVYIAGRRQAELDKAVLEIGKNVTGVKTDISRLDDLDHLYETVAKKGKIDVIFAGAAFVEKTMTAAATPEHFDKTFNTNARGTYFTVQKALPHLNDGASIILVASAGKNKGFPDIIAVFPPLAFLIDAKQGARHRDTGKHAIEQSSLKAMLILEKALNISAWFILPDGAGISAQEADRVKEPGTFLGQGSGTPFWLICNEFTIGNDVLFEQMKLPIRKGRFHCDIPCQYALDDDGKYCYSFCPKCRAITSPKLRP